MKNKILQYIRSQPVLAIAFIAALITAVIIPPDSEYKGYINRAVLFELFALMTAVAGLRETGVIDKVTHAILGKAGNVRRLGIIMVLVCFFSSMLVTNDVGLIIFVPIILILFEDIPDENSRMLTIALSTAAANLGSMITPVGNPQNLYLYDKFRLTAADFVKTMLPAGAMGLLCILGFCFFLPKNECDTGKPKSVTIKKTQTAVFTAVFVICLLCVFRILPDYVCPLAAIPAALAMNAGVLKKVDYSLLATFVCFFIFVGNIARIDAISSFFSEILEGREVAVAALLSQVISNVPAAVMLSGFTDNGLALMLGADIGGLGTIIASLASLISFQFYRKADGARAGQYMLVFTAVNFFTLSVILLFQFIIWG